MIDIFLGGASNQMAVLNSPTKETIQKYRYIYGPIQQPLSIIMVLVGVLMVPVMLCVKPFWEKRKMAQHHSAHVVTEHKEFEVDAEGAYS